MTDTTTAQDNAMLADRAGRLLETLQAREPAEADTQACSMIMAGLALLKEARGIEAVLGILSKVGPVLVAHDKGPSLAPAPTPVSRAPEDFADVALAHLRVLPTELGRAQARAAIVAANLFLRETSGEVQPNTVSPPVTAPTPAPALPAKQLAGAMVDHLRAMPPQEAHERASAVLAGSAGFLHATYGAGYASAMIDGTLKAAAEYGAEQRGGRETLEALH